MNGVDEFASRVSSFVGLALLLVAVAQMLRIMTAAARRSARSWGLVARHVRRASAARATARRARERFTREHETSDAYRYLRHHTRNRER